ncbi:type II toxin-antitoxin system Phd/YefM family antitoxin [Micromonospora rosaria]|uniref:type II toxin-antitoxin system Phd/YefM family antitoxin n=1 Tax=Micromonospora rosaria TaxID=47874 RepID=UPI000A04B9D9|nr:type II toxin-antitoxin system prevent-host-death family antitoxin [Micromonospora rosaria]
MSTRKVGIEDARKRLGDLVTAAQQGADIILTRNGRPVARLIPYEEPADES